MGLLITAPTIQDLTKASTAQDQQTLFEASFFWIKSFLICF